MLRGRADAALAACAGAPALSGAAEAAGAGDLGVLCSRLIDGLSDEPSGASVVVIGQGRIGALGPRAAVPGGMPRLDLSSHTCLPGLIDMHTHLLDSPEDTADLRVHLARSRKEALRRGRRHAKATLMAGFTTVRDVGAYLGWADREVRGPCRGEGRSPGRHHPARARGGRGAGRGRGEASPREGPLKPAAAK